MAVGFNVTNELNKPMEDCFVNFNVGNHDKIEDSPVLSCKQKNLSYYWMILSFVVHLVDRM